MLYGLDELYVAITSKFHNAVFFPLESFGVEAASHTGIDLSCLLLQVPEFQDALHTTMCTPPLGNALRASTPCVG
jgi:hypothetical protein